jgi:hypothetical protein
MGSLWTRPTPGPPPEPATYNWATWLADKAIARIIRGYKAKAEAKKRGVSEVEEREEIWLPPD